MVTQTEGEMDEVDVPSVSDRGKQRLWFFCSFFGSVFFGLGLENTLANWRGTDGGWDDGGDGDGGGTRGTTGVVGDRGPRRNERISVHPPRGTTEVGGGLRNWSRLGQIDETRSSGTDVSPQTTNFRLPTLGADVRVLSGTLTRLVPRGS